MDVSAALIGLPVKVNEIHAEGQFGDLAAYPGHDFGIGVLEEERRKDSVIHVVVGRAAYRMRS